jgi:hypothetical protein
MTTDELKKLVEAATPGPWHKNENSREIYGPASTGEVVVVYDGGLQFSQDARLIAAAPALAREVIALREAAGELAGCVDALLKLDFCYGTRSTVHDITTKSLATLRAVLGENE